ncbi:transmembrane protein 121B-like [Clytia hemisphaerica]|uniref:Uncharacterized protein n=1 Tax=Clytia hemisphaerica TaxID=252671 RepID=A0A7M5X7U1_9CNID|eukprot:TCONS_00060756-protein
MVNYSVEILAKVVCVGMVLFQGLMFNGYMVLFHNSLWWLWSIVDGLLILSWTILLVVVWRAYRKKEKAKETQDLVDGVDLTKFPDEIKYAYIVWIVYALCLVPRLIILYRRDVSNLLEKNILGPNFCKIATSCTPLIFMLLVYALHDAKQVATRKYFLASMVGSVTLDLFDSIDLLEFLFEKEDQRLYPRPILDATLAFACINIFLPSLALMEIKVNRFDGQVGSLPFKIFYEGCFVFLVNIPNLLIRSILWHQYNADVSVLIMKNVMCICLGLGEIIRYFTEERPKQCPKCGLWYEREFYDKHFASCTAMERTPLNQEL